MKLTGAPWAPPKRRPRSRFFQPLPARSLSVCSADTTATTETVASCSTASLLLLTEHHRLGGLNAPGSAFNDTGFALTALKAVAHSSDLALLEAGLDGFAFMPT
jgi:hypothetical protein